MHNLKPCPVCGKKPKLKIDYNYEADGYGGWVEIKCKPFLRRPHLIVVETSGSNYRALESAIKKWNERA